MKRRRRRMRGMGSVNENSCPWGPYSRGRAELADGIANAHQIGPTEWVEGAGEFGPTKRVEGVGELRPSEGAEEAEEFGRAHRDERAEGVGRTDWAEKAEGDAGAETTESLWAVAEGTGRSERGDEVEGGGWVIGLWNEPERLGWSIPEGMGSSEG